jgi:hypothetical protein
MRVKPWLTGLIGGDISVRKLDRVRNAGVDAYDLVDQLPRGPARLAAWNAYVLRTYADKLIAACQAGEYVRADTANVALQLYALSGRWVERAQQIAAGTAGPALPEPLPHWHTPVRSQVELVGMRETLDVLRVYLTFDLQSFHGDDLSITELRGRLAAINAKVDAADGLWLPRAPDELRGGIGDALADGLDLAYALGQSLAMQTLAP